MDKTCRRWCTLRLIVISLFISVFFYYSIFNSERNGILEDASRKEEKKKNTSRQTARKRRHLVHVISPYVVEDGTLDLNQWTAMESIRRALLHAPPNDVMKVDFVCAIFESDWKALVTEVDLPCHRFVLLERSTRTQYPHLSPQRDLPFVSDLVEAAAAAAATFNNLTIHHQSSPTTHNDAASFHVMLTNADIGLSKHFYNYLYTLLQRFDSFSINRMTIPIEKVAAMTTPNATELVEHQIDRLILDGKNHPGKDMFCMSSSVLKRITFGDFFLGRPPWGANIHLMLQIMSDKYANIKSNVNGTFHLGNDAVWKQPASHLLLEGSNDTESSNRLRMFCPESGAISDELGLQNHLNCGSWFLGNQTIRLPTTVEEKHPVMPIYVPGFVRPNYEDLYLQRYSKHLHYSEEGWPLKPESRLAPGKNTKAQGMFTGLVSRIERWKEGLSG